MENEFFCKPHIADALMAELDDERNRTFPVIGGDTRNGDLQITMKSLGNVHIQTKLTAGQINSLLKCMTVNMQVRVMDGRFFFTMMTV